MAAVAFFTFTCIKFLCHDSAIHRAKVPSRPLVFGLNLASNSLWKKADSALYSKCFLRFLVLLLPRCRIETVGGKESKEYAVAMLKDTAVEWKTPRSENESQWGRIQPVRAKVRPESFTMYRVQLKWSNWKHKLAITYIVQRVEINERQLQGSRVRGDE